MNLYLMQHIPTAVFVFCFGASVGSFLNVVIYRLPAGMSVVSPPSRCPTCGARLKFFGDNLPILGWFLIRGKCRYCGVRVSSQYMVIEALVALIFLGLYVVFFMVRPSIPWWGSIGSSWWYYTGPFFSGPAFVALAFLIAGLIAMTIIDARTFTIPIQIPVFVTIVAFIAYPLQALMPVNRRAADLWPIQVTGWQTGSMIFGAMLGILIAFLLLKLGKFRYSFLDYEEYVKEGETLGDYPHARREMMVELVYLTPCLVGAVVGWFLGRFLPTGPPPVFLQAMGGTFAGYLMGGGLIWGIRILASLAFGKEAMGLGDVHLMAAVGAVLGWFDPILIFFLAPFSGLIWIILSRGFATVMRKRWTELPYGPHLAIATLVVVFCRPGIQAGWQNLFSVIPWPSTSLCVPPATTGTSANPAAPPGSPTP